MKFGNASWGFRELPLEEQLRITNSMGLDVLELGIANAPKDLPLLASVDDIIQVKNLFEKYGIQLKYAATGNDFTNGNPADVDKVKKVLDICSSLGIQYLRIFSGFAPMEEVKGRRWEIMIQCLLEVNDYAQGVGVHPVIETHGGVSVCNDGVMHFMSVSTHPGSLERMMTELPDYTELCYDPANSYAVGIHNPAEIFRKYRKRISMAHFKEFCFQPSGSLRPASCGEGDMDWERLLHAMDGWNGMALFEYENTEDIEAGSRRCHKFLKRVLDGRL